ncbi:MAG: type II secretion protein F [Alphaproteobacteria bacterium PRO2]|nr:type II secretion protein F [Alphaproteobacteria bacterium PRO2]
MTTLQIVLTILIMIIIVGSAAAFLMMQENERKKRIAAVIKGHATNEKKFSAEDVQNKRRAEIAKKLKESKEEEDQKKGKKKKRTIALMLEQAGLTISVKRYWAYSLISMVVCVIIAKLLGQAPFVIVMAAIIGLFGVPRFVLRFLTKRRQKKFLMEFADALEAIIRLLKAGMPVAEAIAMISREFTGPVGEEMSRIYDKQKIGIPIHEAAQQATKRMPLTEMQMFATGLAIQSQTGSSLSEVLKNLANVIRSRFRLKRKIKALSSEAISSAGIIGSLPILLALGMYFANREYIMILFTDPFGNVLLGIAVVWMLIGIFVMKIMINFKI